MRLKSRQDPKLAAERENITAAEAELAEAAKIQKEKRIAHQRAMRRWAIERDFQRLEESRKQLERAKAEELQQRRRILFGWRDKQKEGKV